MRLDLSRFERPNIAGVPLSLHTGVFPIEVADYFARALAAEIGMNGRELDTTGDDEHRGINVRFVQVAARAPWVPSSYKPFPQLEAFEVEAWPPLIAMLAGHCAATLGVLPDIVSANLFRDGRDFLPWHIDAATLGPTADELFAGTYSFGSERILSFRPIDRSEPAKGIPIPHNSLYVMDLDANRRYAHRVAAEPGRVGPRVSVAFFVRQKDGWERRPWIAVSSIDGPLVSGTYDDALRAMLEHEADLDKMTAHERMRRAHMPNAAQVVVIGPTGRAFTESAGMRQWAYGRGLTDAPPWAMPDDEAPPEGYTSLGGLRERLDQGLDAPAEATALARVDESPARDTRRMRRRKP